MKAVKLQVEAKGVEQLITVEERRISAKQAGLQKSMEVQMLGVVQQDRFPWSGESTIVRGKIREGREKGGGEGREKRGRRREEREEEKEEERGKREGRQGRVGGEEGGYYLE